MIPSDYEKARKGVQAMIRGTNLEHLLHLSDIQEAVTKVGTDTRLSETTRQRLADLWKTQEAFRLDYIAPLGSLAEYRARCQRNSIALEELSDSLRVILGVEQHELTVTLK